MSLSSGLAEHVFVIAVASLVYRLSPIPSFRRVLSKRVPWIGAVERTSVLGDVRGGDSFSDIYGLKRFLIATLPVASVIWIKGSIVLFPQTYGPYKSRTARFIARWIIRKASVVIARDKASQAVAQSLARPDQTVLLTPDVAFALHADRMERVELDGREEPMPSGAIGLNVNGLMYNGGYTRKNMFGLKLDYVSFLVDLVPRLLATHPGPLVLIPHTYAPAGDVESDNEACVRLREALAADLRSRVRIVTGDYDCHQLKGIIGACDFFIGSRMHSCIAALSQGVPCVGIAYSMKFRGVFESVGVEEWSLDARHISNETGIQLALELLQLRNAIRAQLVANSNTARLILREVFSSAILKSSSQTV